MYDTATCSYLMLQKSDNALKCSILHFTAVKFLTTGECSEKRLTIIFLF